MIHKYNEKESQNYYVKVIRVDSYRSGGKKCTESYYAAYHFDPVSNVHSAVCGPKSSPWGWNTEEEAWGAIDKVLNGQYLGDCLF